MRSGGNGDVEGKKARKGDWKGENEKMSAMPLEGGRTSTTIILVTT